VELAISLLVSAVVFGAATFTIYFNQKLPKDHQSKDTQDVIRLGTGMISVLASLVLGLLVATTKGTFDQTDTEVKGLATDIIMLDRDLRDYGPPSLAARALLRRFVIRDIHEIWPDHSADTEPQLDDRDAGVLLQSARAAIRALVPTTTTQTEVRTDALTEVNSVVRARWLLIAQSSRSIRPLFLIVLVAWIVLIFASFAFGAPRHLTMLSFFMVSTLAIGGAIFLILEMDSPFSGFIEISPKPMQHALHYIEHD
jgi:hypothetical protein